MALVTVQDILAAWPGWTKMSLDRGMQSSGQGSGEIIVKELRDPLWTLHAETKTLTPNEIRYWNAKLDGLKEGQRLFLGYELTSFYPSSYPNGSWPTGGSFSGTTAAINAIGGDGVSLSLKSLPVGFQGKVGDMISAAWGGGSPAALALWRVLEDFTANGSGITGSFEVAGAIPAGVAADNVVAVKKPSCHMILVPGSIKLPSDKTGRGVISFDAIQRPVP